jgi:hypothetical protein
MMSSILGGGNYSEASFPEGLGSVTLPEPVPFSPLTGAVGSSMGTLPFVSFLP